MTRRRHLTMVILTVSLVTAWFVATLVGTSRPLLGLDLQGGISVVLFPVEGSDTTTLDTAVDIIRNRVDALGVVEPEVTRQGNTIVVDLPGAKNREQALSIIGQTAQLQFRPVCGQLALAPYDPEAKPLSVDDVPVASIPGCDAPSTAAAAGTTTTTAPGATTVPGAVTTTVPTTAATVTTAGTTAPPSSQGGRAAITPVGAIAPRGEGRAQQAADATTTVAPAATTTVPVGTTVAGAPTTTVAGATTTTVAGATTTTAPPASSITAGVKTTPRKADAPEVKVVLPCKISGCTAEDAAQAGVSPDSKNPKEQPRLVLGSQLLSGDAVSNAKARFDEQGQWLVDVTFRGQDFVTKVAQPYVGQRVAIALDGVIQSAPTINEGITGRQVQISGAFSQKEAKNLALVLRYGSLPVQFDQEQQTVRSVSPSLGKDQLHAGIVAGIVGLVLVAIYMTIFYRILGLVVISGLLLTGMIFFGLVTFLGNQQGLTLTLAGVTGLIVSVGITVDSYVVYFERLKDEARSGKTVRSSVDTGFPRAFRTIIAADLVSLFAAGILYWLAEGSVRGFAFFLGLSTIIDLVLAYTFMHPLVSLMARNPRLVRMPGIGIAAGLDLAGAEA